MLAGGDSSTSEAATVANRNVTTDAGTLLNFPDDSPVPEAFAHLAGVIFTPGIDCRAAVIPGSDP
jgi:hypothetical protein